MLNEPMPLIECMRLGFAEALRWVSDPKFSDLPQILYCLIRIHQSRRDD